MLNNVTATFMKSPRMFKSEALFAVPNMPFDPNKFKLNGKMAQDLDIDVVNFGGGKEERPFNIGIISIQALLNRLIPMMTVPTRKFIALKAHVMKITRTEGILKGIKRGL